MSSYDSCGLCRANFIVGFGVWNHSVAAAGAILIEGTIGFEAEIPRLRRTLATSWKGAICGAGGSGVVAHTRKA